MVDPRPSDAAAGPLHLMDPRDTLPSNVKIFRPDPSAPGILWHIGVTRESSPPGGSVMGRKSRAKAARRAARANEAMAWPDQIVAPHQPPGRTSTPSMQGEWPAREVSPLAAPRLPSSSESARRRQSARRHRHGRGCRGQPAATSYASWSPAKSPLNSRSRTRSASSSAVDAAGRTSAGLSACPDREHVSDSSQPRSLKRIGSKGGDSRDWPCSAATGFAKT